MTYAIKLFIFDEFSNSHRICFQRSEVIALYEAILKKTITILSFYNGFIKTRFTCWKERSEKFSNIKGTPEHIWKDILYVKYDFKFHVEDIDTVFFILADIRIFIFGKRYGMKSITMKVIIFLYVISVLGLKRMQNHQSMLIIKVLC